MSRQVEPYTRRRFLDALLWIAPATVAVPQVVLAAGKAAAAPKPVKPPKDLSFLSKKVEFMRRTAWTKVGPNPARLRKAEKFYRITVHHQGCGVNVHTARGDVAYDLEGILTGHRKRCFGDIGYHVIIDRAGRVWEGRSPRYDGAHVSGQNVGNIGIMLLGNFERQRPANLQLATMDKVVGVLRAKFTIAGRNVYGHRDLGHTLCPGRYLYPSVSKIKRT